MSNNTSNQANKDLDLPSTPTTCGGERMHTRSYAKALIEGIRRAKDAVKEVSGNNSQNKTEEKKTKKMTMLKNLLLPLSQTQKRSCNHMRIKSFWKKIVWRKSTE